MVSPKWSVASGKWWLSCQFGGVHHVGWSIKIRMAEYLQLMSMAIGKRMINHVKLAVAAVVLPLAASTFPGRHVGTWSETIVRQWSQFWIDIFDSNSKLLIELGSYQAQTDCSAHPMVAVMLIAGQFPRHRSHFSTWWPDFCAWDEAQKWWRHGELRWI